jgi:hypothetical protein
MTEAEVRKWAVEHITTHVGVASWEAIMIQADKLAKYVLTGNVPEPKEAE